MSTYQPLLKSASSDKEMVAGTSTHISSFNPVAGLSSQQGFGGGFGTSHSSVIRPGPGSTPNSTFTLPGSGPSRGRSLTPNPLQPGATSNGSASSTSFIGAGVGNFDPSAVPSSLQGLFNINPSASQASGLGLTSQPSPNTRSSGYFPSSSMVGSGNTGHLGIFGGGMSRGSSGLPVSASGPTALSAIFPSPNSAGGSSAAGKDLSGLKNSTTPSLNNAVSKLLIFGAGNAGGSSRNDLLFPNSGSGGGLLQQQHGASLGGGGGSGGAGGPLGLSETDFPLLTGNFGSGGGLQQQSSTGAGGGLGSITGGVSSTLMSSLSQATPPAGGSSLPFPPPLPPVAGGSSAPMGAVGAGYHHAQQPQQQVSSGMSSSPHPSAGGFSSYNNAAITSASTSSGGGLGAGGAFATSGAVFGSASNPFQLYGQPPPPFSAGGSGQQQLTSNVSGMNSMGPGGSSVAVGSGRTISAAMISGFDASGVSSGNFAGLIKPSDSQSEFQINNEDFPALQGPQNDTRPGNLPLISDSSKDGRKSSEKSILSPKEQSGIQTTLDGNVSNIPAGMIRDQFGMVGMLTFLRALEGDASIVSLALGTELTHLGLNLNAPTRNLFQTFAGPWMETPCRAQDIDCHVPTEYLTNMAIRERMAPIKLNRYGDDLLFFLFYMCTGETFQLGAAIELYKRDWRYCKEDRLWITRPQGMPPHEKTDTYERGMYYVFDPTQWRKFPKEMILEYAKLEKLDIPAAPSGQQQQLLQSYGGGGGAGGSGGMQQQQSAGGATLHNPIMPSNVPSLPPTINS